MLTKLLHDWAFAVVGARKAATAAAAAASSGFPGEFDRHGAKAHSSAASVCSSSRSPLSYHLSNTLTLLFISL